MNDTIFTGAATALITPFRHGEIDYPALKRIIEFQLSQKIAALVISGTTGECATLCEKEKTELFAFCVDCVGGRAPVIAGTGSNDTARACRLSRAARECGCDGLLCVTPYYNKASDSGIYEHYCRIKESAPTLPVILYNVPARTGVNVSLPTLRRLSESGTVQAIKEASGNLSRVADIAHDCPCLKLYSGNDDQTLPIMSLGGKGVISVISNVLPAETQTMCELYLDGKVSDALKIQLDRLPLFHLLFEDVNPIPVKYLMHLFGFCENEYRLPLTPPSPELCRKLEKAVSELK